MYQMLKLSDQKSRFWPKIAQMKGQFLTNLGGKIQIFRMFYR